MLVYEKKVEGERHLFGKVEGTIPAADDTQLTYKDADGTTITPELSDVYLNDGHGGIIRKSDGEAINVFIGETQIIGGEITPTVASLRIDKNPTKVTFTEGEQLEYYGIEITLVYSDGTEEGVSEDPALTFDPDWGTTATVDMTSVTVTHTTYNVSTSFPITVEAEAPTITGIEVTTEPTKTSYTDGESLDLTGMVVTGNLSNGETVDVTADCTTTPVDGAVLTTDPSGEISVVVSYFELTDTFTITVS